jgi:O-antigen/teichoic acid export membrane protein
MTLGSQMVNASQIMILGRFAGLESAASFSVGTKLYSMGQQFVGKVIESSAPALTELHLSGDSDRFRQRFWNTLALSALLASFVASVIIVGNKSLVSLWTSGSVGWGFSSDVLLGILLVLTACTRVLLALFGICGNLRPVRFISVSEGCVFVVLGIPAAILYGITGLLAVSLLAHVLVTGLLSLHKARQLLHPTKGSLRYVWVSLLAITVSIFSGFLCTTACKSPFHALLVLLPATAGAVLLLCWKLMLPMQLRKELLARLKGFVLSIIP